jgi:DNA-binding response OmpR family regulator
VKILFVHDPILENLVRTLTRAGHEVLAMEDVRPPSQHYLRAFRPQVVLIASPNGPPLCRALRELAPRSPIITITQGPDPDEKVRALEAGADDCIGTPFHEAELLARIDAVRRRTTKPETLAAPAPVRRTD